MRHEWVLAFCRGQQSGGGEAFCGEEQGQDLEEEQDLLGVQQVQGALLEAVQAGEQEEAGEHQLQQLGAGVLLPPDPQAPQAHHL